MRHNMKHYEITNIDTGATYIWDEATCVQHFGKNEWPEYRDGFLGNIFVMPVDNAKLLEERLHDEY